MTGGEDERLAPVIPLFGGPVPERPTPRHPASRRPRPTPEPDPDPAVEAAVSAVIEAFERVGRREASNGDATSTVDGPWPDDVGAVAADIAPPAPLTANDPAWHPTWSADRRTRDIDDAGDSPDVELAEKVLLKKLRTRSLSVAEARNVLRQYDLDQATTDHLLASMAEYGYLDDGALAEQLIHAGVDRKGQGRQVIAHTLAKRGIPRDVADAALTMLPDDDLERALEFARGKARSLQSLDRDTALRRLTGQLARRGYGGSIAMTAARTALDEQGSGSSVRFR